MAESTTSKALATESLEVYDDSTALLVDTWQVKVHDLIARGVAAERRRQGLTQEQVALMFRSHGLRAWRKGTVGQLEAGLRKPRLDEVLLMARALSLTLDKLIPGGDEERIELGDDAEVSPHWIREMLSGDLYRDRPLEELPYERFPVDELMAEALIRSEAEKKRVGALVAPIQEWAEQHDVKIVTGDWLAMFETASDSEQHVARRLGVEIAQVKLSARVLWDHRDFDDERDSRIGDVDELEPRSRQARRGLVTRGMLAELRAFLDEIYGTRERDAGGERQVVDP
jgi:transcriptional regulator with XRE-family HTH domain